MSSVPIHNINFEIYPNDKMCVKCGAILANHKMVLKSNINIFFIIETKISNTFIV